MKYIFNSIIEFAEFPNVLIFVTFFSVTFISITDCFVCF